MWVNDIQICINSLQGGDLVYIMGNGHQPSISLHLEVEANDEAREGALHFAHGQRQHNCQEGQGQGRGLEKINNNFRYFFRCMLY